eukprot:gene27093-32735_t
MKYASNGTREWTRMEGSSDTGADIGFGVSVHPSTGDLYVTGYVGGARYGQSYAGRNDIILIKYSSNGTRVWTRMEGTAGNDVGYGVSVHPITGDVYVTGYAEAALHGQAYAGGWDIILMKFASNGTRVWTRMEGSADIILMKFASNGTRVWTRMEGATFSDAGYGASVHPSTGDVYVTGYVGGALHGQSYVGGNDIILIKYSSNGTRVWTRMEGTTGWDEGRGVSVQSSTGDVYVTGYVGGALHGQSYAGGRDIILIKYASNGTRVWTRMEGTAGNDVGFGVSAHPSTGNVYVTGYAEAALHAPSSGFPTYVPTPPLSTCIPTATATFFLGFTASQPRGNGSNGNTSSSVGNSTGPSVNTSLAISALSSISVSQAEMVVVTEEVRVVSQTLPRSSPGSSVAIALPLTEQEIVLQAEGKLVLPTISLFASSNASDNGSSHSRGVDLYKEATIQAAVTTSSLLLFVSKIKQHRRNSISMAFRILPSQLASLPVDAVPSRYQEINDVQKRNSFMTVIPNSFAAVQCDMDTLESAIHQYRSMLLSCGGDTFHFKDSVGTTKDSMLAEFDRQWCLDSSTGLFLEFKSRAKMSASMLLWQPSTRNTDRLDHNLDDENAVLVEAGLANKEYCQLDACFSSPESSLASMFIQDLFSDVESSSEGMAEKIHRQFDVCAVSCGSSDSSSADSIFIRDLFSDVQSSSSYGSSRSSSSEGDND